MHVWLFHFTRSLIIRRENKLKSYRQLGRPIVANVRGFVRGVYPSFECEKRPMTTFMMIILTD